VISIPILDNGEPTGPMLNGMTYIVRPEIWTALTDILHWSCPRACSKMRQPVPVDNTVQHYVQLLYTYIKNLIDML
jgi:hypothetical protein